jgi:hypothetical protein
MMNTKLGNSNHNYWALMIFYIGSTTSLPKIDIGPIVINQSNLNPCTMVSNRRCRALIIEDCTMFVVRDKKINSIH